MFYPVLVKIQTCENVMSCLRYNDSNAGNSMFMFTANLKYCSYFSVAFHISTSVLDLKTLDMAMIVSLDNSLLLDQLTQSWYLSQSTTAAQGI